MKLEWTIQSFDPHTSIFNSVQSSLIFASIHALDDQKRAYIRIGSRFRKAHPLSQTSKNSLTETCVMDKDRIVEKNHSAAMIAKYPNEGNRFTIDKQKEDGERHKDAPEALQIIDWNCDEGGNQIFWNTVNQILDLDTHSPVRKVLFRCF